ncbi:LuxR C-terminal-related transcriptional regulator [Gordonia jinhuaensis]|uniref:Transcriptional regulator n=1 Tax=Gordonia jinhuaensis TaxID=1517702 RepID=A0A916T219_9ACTN|nr:LuxR C-terminal-related transcriptional regulator [Gordonia jinhuaensis]GGB26706.1 transcriptional regulator [Gordonia jinhuaensis]
MARLWPMITRGLEYDTITTALTSTSGECGVVLTGSAGVGKTTLARQATSSVGGNVRWVAGTESARSIPLGVFAHLVGSRTSSDPVSYMAAARESLLADGNLVIGVDDAHLLDEMSATFLHHLAIDRSAHIIATVRDGEAVPDAVISLWKDGHLHRIDLQPFTREQSVEYIESALGGRLEGLSADLMWRASGGNALYLHHLVDGALESETLKQVRGVWQLRGRAEVTSELASLLEGRIEQLDGDVKRVLRLLTFCEPLDLDVLADLAGEDAVDEAETRGLIRVSRESDRLAVRYTHPLFGDVVRRRLGVTASRRLRGELVKAMRHGALSTAADRIRLAQLALDSDETVDKGLLTAAANDAISLAKVPLGAQFATAALSAGAGFPAAAVLARAQLYAGDAAESERTLAEFDVADIDGAELVWWAVTRISNLLWAMGESERADEALALLDSRVKSPAGRLTVAGITAAVKLFENEIDEAITNARTVLDDPTANPWAVGFACLGGGLSLAVSGHGNEVAEVAARMDEVVAHTDGLLRYPAGTGQILGLTLSGRMDDARRAANDFREFSSAGQYLAWGMSCVLTGIVDLAQGLLDDAAVRCEQALAAFDSESASSWGFPARIALVEAYSGLGRVEEAESALTDAIRRSGRHVAVYEPQLRISKAWLAAAHGLVGEAAQRARDAARFAAASGQTAIEAEALHFAARCGDHGVADRLSEIAGRVDGELVDIYLRHALALAADDGAELDSCARQFERVGALLSAADAAAAAAMAHDRAGRRTAAATSSAAAIRLAARCGGARTPALTLAAQPLPLTTREREIATLVAAGLSNKQIADRLTVSVRTVEGHIYRACTKLDLSDRAELATMLQGAPG